MASDIHGGARFSVAVSPSASPDAVLPYGREYAAPAGTLFPSSKAPAPSARRLSDQSGTSGHSLPTPRLPPLLLSEKGCASYPRLQTSPAAPGGLSGKGLRFPDGPERLLSVPPQALRIRQRQGRDSGTGRPTEEAFPAGIFLFQYVILFTHKT